VRCRRCLGFSQRRPPNFCANCAKPLSKPQYRLCKLCSCKSPERAGKVSEAHKRRIAERGPWGSAADPALAIERLRSPSAIAKRQKGKAARGRSRSRMALGWCPEEYWDSYRKLRKRRGAASARAIVERHLGGPLRSVSMTAPQMRRNECSIAGESTRLTPLATNLLSVLLLNHPDRYLGTNELIERVWPDPDFEPDSACDAIKQYVFRLRGSGIRIVRAKSSGRGYRIPREARLARSIS
jgi:hypothetical protein